MASLKYLNAPLPKVELNPICNSIKSLTSNIDEMSSNLLTLYFNKSIKNTKLELDASNGKFGKGDGANNYNNFITNFKNKTHSITVTYNVTNDLFSILGNLTYESLLDDSQRVFDYYNINSKSDKSDLIGI